jgi:hypothetical protein
MAVSKHTRASGCETNPFFLELFRDSSDFTDERERRWHTAMVHSGESTPPLRFPVYESLYLINVYSQNLVDLLEEACDRFSVRKEYLTLYLSMIQYVRAGASQDILDLMNDVEITEEWLFEQQRKREEQEFRNSDDINLEAKRREAECKAKDLPPRVQFQEEGRSTGKSDAQHVSKRKRR